MDRLKRIKEMLRRRDLDALLVTQPENRRYLSGFSAGDMGINESSGTLLVPRRGQPVLMTDFRFQLEAETEAGGFQVMIYKRGMLALLKKVLADREIKRLAFESHYFLHHTAGKLADLTGSIRIDITFIDPHIIGTAHPAHE